MISIFMCTFIFVLQTNNWNIIQGLWPDQMCRETRSGSEYVGKISVTRTGNVCEYWEILNLSNNDFFNYSDYDFPDGSIKAARNFCRNPNNSPHGLWCYLKSNLKKKENCAVPICSNTKGCRTTGPGMEYAGFIQKSIFDNECLHWAATSRNDNYIDEMLPEGSTMFAGKSCRNPTGSVAGPWCYIFGGEDNSYKEDREIWIKEFCDVPICFNQKFITVVYNHHQTKSENYYTHFSSIQDEKEQILFSIQLWNPEDWKNGKINIALTSLSIPVTGEQIREWDIGYEVILKNLKGGVTPSEGEEKTWKDHPGLVSGVRWTYLKLSWSNGFISLTSTENEKSYFIHEYIKRQNGILSEEKAKIKYISMMGTVAFFNFSQNDSYCQEHITTSSKFTRYWSFSTNSLNKYLSLHLRSTGNCIIEFKISPPVEFPRVQLKIQESGKTNIIIYKSESKSQILASTVLKNSLTYWKWTEFSISISGHRFQMLVETKQVLETLFDINHVIFQGMKWYGIASESTSHWTLFCTPSQDEYEAIPPECSVSKADLEYQGHQWITQSGLPCLPWIANFIELEKNKFPEGSIAEALNFCRNPTAEFQGSFCFTVNLSATEISITKELCHLRKCKFKDCRISGTANDFMGQISTTISGRECQAWSSNQPHTVERYLLNDDLYPERSVKNAKNYCRDPSDNIAGPWCYSLDSKVNRDLCHVPDCYKPTHCTVIVTTSTRRKIFIVPHWRTDGIPLWIKMWNPNIVTVLVLNFYPLNNYYKYQLVIGDDENENIKLYYISKSEEKVLLKQKTTPHFLKSGRWVGIVIKLQDDEINISYEGVSNPFFSWKKDEDSDLPNSSATFFSYEAKSEDNLGSLGLNFPCDTCHTEVCNKELTLYSVYYPTNIWFENAAWPLKNISFYLRGSGVFTINFFLLPSKFPNGILLIDDGSFGDLIEMQMVRTRYLDRTALKNKGTPAIEKEYWSNFVLAIGEKEGSLILNGTKFMNWINPSIQLYYYFSVQCTEEITWVVNCRPPKIDGTPINGGWSAWSSWECSASCGGGRGVRRRNCTEPEPSMFGQNCQGASIERGSCNENVCGQVSTTTINLIKKNLGQRAQNIQVYVHDPLEIKCNPSLLKVIQTESPKSLMYWNKNGVKISEDTIIEDIDTKSFQIEIKAANISDSGVYACIIIKPEVHEVMDITAVTVKTKGFTKTKRIGQKMFLKANTVVLNSVYSNLRLTWYLNNSIYKEYDITDLRLIDEEIVNPIKWEHEGEWSSVIFQDQLGLNWSTSWYRLQVLRTGNWATYLLGKDLLKGRLGENEIVIYIAVILLLLIVLLITVAFTYFIIRLRSFFKILPEK